MKTTRRGFIQSAGAASLLGSGSIALPAAIGDAAGNGKLTPAEGRKRVILDTDTATDDAVAILLALHAPNIKVEAITIAPGNVGFEQQTQNALYTLQVAGKANEVPVFQGSARAITRAVHAGAEYVHGRDGMGNSFFPAPQQKAETEPGVDAIVRLVRLYPGEITLVAIGALTNLALALLRDPGIAPLVKCVYVMGGCYKFYGNVTPAATFNIWVDPEAARIVFQSGIPIVTAGFDISVYSSVFTDVDYASVERLGTTLSKFFLDINRVRRVYCKEHQKMNGSNHPDALTMALVIDPTIGTQMLPRFVDIETQGELTRGALLIDELGVWKQPPNATICAAADEAKFKAMVFATLAAR